MQLVERDLIDLDVAVTNYLPEFTMLPRFTNDTPITVRNLIDMHSGIPGDLDNNNTTIIPIGPTASNVMQRLSHDYPTYPPNFVYMYSNSGYEIMELIIQRMSGIPLADYAKTNMFQRLGMDHSSYVYDSAFSNHLANSYSGGLLWPLAVGSQYAQGSIFSSTHDLSKAIISLLDYGAIPDSTNRLLLAETFSEMITPQATNVPLDVSTNILFGLGWDAVAVPQLNYAGRLCTKNGATAVMSHILWNSSLLLFIDQQLGAAVILSGSDRLYPEGEESTLADAVSFETMRWATYEKNDLHWPTNNYEAPYSPPTNRPQSELNAITGIYVTAAGYDVINANTNNSTLTWLISGGLQTVTNIVPRMNGWFSEATSQLTQLEFTNISGQDVIIKHTCSYPQPFASLYGNRYEPTPISAAWSNRCANKWFAINLNPFDYGLTYSPSAITFYIKDDLLLSGNSTVIAPQNDNLAFIQGLFNRNGSSYQVTTNASGAEIIAFSSYILQNTATLPELPLNTVVATNLEANAMLWYHFPGQYGRTYRLQGASNCILLLIDNDFGQPLASSYNGNLRWPCTSNATYWLAISATNTTTFGMQVQQASQPTPVNFLLLEE